jgi:hypothetical protein
MIGRFLSKMFTLARENPAPVSGDFTNARNVGCQAKNLS